MEDRAHPPEHRKPAASGSWQQSMREASAYLGLGMQMALTMSFFVAGGYYLDRWLGTAPWLLLAGAVLGMVSIFLHLFRLVADLNKKSAARRKAKDADQPPAATP